ncbi:MAG: hypothetical protein ACMX3H_08590 [Sodalis sp. (in: enterobacteria)]|uniref:hypothetical protein n=1 Tax=Sodalis sp. (in: enterobacteria) TaxID=1898979 RepID=UPI0039E4D151
MALATQQQALDQARQQAQANSDWLDRHAACGVSSSRCGVSSSLAATKCKRIAATWNSAWRSNGYGLPPYKRKVSSA